MCSFAGVFGAVLGGSFAAGVERPPVDFARDVRPILQTHCWRCHGEQEQESGLRLDSATSLAEGGNSGPAVIPGKAADSALIQAVTGAKGVSRMPPPDEAPRLSDAQIDALRRWIDDGAKWPADETPANTPKFAASATHWSFQRARRPALLAVLSPAWATGPIDTFILAKLDQRKIFPSPPADRVTLIRRLSLDLLGLPPSLAEVESFANDSSPDAFERLADRLLASPHYGERFGRLWLDQARYADSDGYSNDAPRVMWPYRDYVIDALNRDLPFDQFTLEQLAGDLLPGATQRQLIATGFHRNTQLYSEGDSATEEFRVENVVDRVHTTGVVFLGLTLECARCHDHKFDPISQREFYQLFAFLNDQDEPTLPVEVPNGPRTSTLVLRERSTPRETRIHIRGEFTRLGRVVKPGVPDVLHDLPPSAARPNRLVLARWIVAPQNPLTGRVTVNRIWRTFFGRGLVETDEDFGTRGDRPSHPELLDWLASEFVERGWSVKSLQRSIVTSSAYRQASRQRADLRTADPQNLLLARQNRNRLDAELVRDVSLAAAGLLSTKLKGPSVFPPQPDGVMRFSQTANRQWEASRGEDRYRRGMYTYFWRLTPYPMLTLFDGPEANTTCTRRPRSNTPLQALTLLNDAAFVESAQALAERVQRDLPFSDSARRLRYAFQLCVAREPTDTELAILARLLASDEKTAWISVARVLLNLDETITRE